MVGRRRCSLRHDPEHEVATGDPREELCEIIADRERASEDAGLVADEGPRDVQHRARDVGLVHQRNRPSDELERGLDLELGVGLRQQVAKAAERLLAQRGVERAEAAFDRDASRHDVPGAVAADVPDGGVALHSVLLEALDDRVQPLDDERPALGDRKSVV